MGSPEVLNFDALLTPISSGTPSGESLRYTGVYDSIVEAKREDDALPMGDWQRDVKMAEWHTVIKLTTDALDSKAKDLQIAVWLVEALTKVYGFPGLRDGFRLLRELQERFWETLHPTIEDGDLETRSAPLEWLDRRLVVLVGEIPLTGGDSAYSWHRWEESRLVDNLARQSEGAVAQAVAEGKITGEQFDKSVAATPRVFYEQLSDDVEQTWTRLDALTKFVDERFGRDAPSLLGIRKALENCRSLIDSILKKKRALDPTYHPPAQPPASPSTSAQTTTSAVDASTALLTSAQANNRPEDHNTAPSSSAQQFAFLPLEPTSRDDAFRRLAAIAEYLKRVEPQSPVSYLVDRAVRWSKMPLEDWLGEVVQNDDVLGRLRDTLGIMPKDTA